jgi:hypothetical protein
MPGPGWQSKILFDSRYVVSALGEATFPVCYMRRKIVIQKVLWRFIFSPILPKRINQTQPTFFTSLDGAEDKTKLRRAADGAWPEAIGGSPTRQLRGRDLRMTQYQSRLERRFEILCPRFGQFASVISRKAFHISD